MRELARQAGEACLARGYRLAVAESCTGGLLGGAITSIPGSSRWFLGGVVAYADRLKSSLLGVEPSLLAAHGAVSAEVAAAMARGARDAAGAEAALAVTGVAGPGGGTPGKPVGTVFIAAATPRGEVVRPFRFPGERERVREAAVEAALRLFLELTETRDA